MIRISHILCPIDFSEASRHALTHGLALARWYDAKLTALHVRYAPRLPMPPLLLAPAGSGMAPIVAVPDRTDMDVQILLASTGAADVHTDIAIVDGSPAQTILEEASSRKADVIVLGTHGRDGLKRLMLGSVAETVLRRAFCPVLVVPPAAIAKSRLPFKRILCPIDFSDPSVAALRFALSVAEESDARLSILHVFEWASDDDLTPGAVHRRHLWEATTRDDILGLIPPEARAWCEPAPTLAYGRADEQTLARAEAEHADLIVIGIRGRNALDLGVFGSTANQVIRHAPCPVLTIRT
jgi:nucleotide-binding universal stress UspA family protein